MDFALTDRCQDFQQRLTAFMDEHVYPDEAVYEEQLREAGDPHAQPAVMEELKEEARHRGLWNMTRADLLTAAQVADLLGVPISTVREWGRNGTLPRIKLGRHVRFLCTQVEATILSARDVGDP
jgi:excisionase family DNA binding protein